MSQLFVVARYWVNQGLVRREVVAFSRDEAEAESLAVIYRARGEFAVGYAAEPIRPSDPVQGQGRASNAAEVK